MIDDDPLDDDTHLSGTAEVSEGARLQAVIVGDSLVQTIPLPERGALRIGRQAKSDIRIDDPSISRFHAVLHLDRPIRIEDLGSANGTRVGDVVVKPGHRVDVQLGDTIKLGSVSMILQRRGKAR